MGTGEDSMTRAVLNFHSIDDSGSSLSFPFRKFVTLIENLLRSGTPVVTFDQLRTLKAGVTITFDDAIESVARSALPVMRDLNAPSHVFVTTGRVGLDNNWGSQPSGYASMKVMTWDAIAACAAGGMTIENHTTTHPDLRLRSRSQIMDECQAADEAIERELGRRPRLLAYPYGACNDLAREIAQERYTAAFTTALDYVEDFTDLHRVPRIGSHYLRSPCPMRYLLSPVGRAYVMSRRALRAFRAA
jgi:peptidoglycan/xylan/chitin deacetylase (PgdA/CDA1 family)